MSLTTLGQFQTLKTNIAANAATIPAGFPWTGAFAGVAVKDVPASNDGNIAVAGWYNQTASPAFVLWKKAVSVAAVGDAINASELAGLTSLNTQRMQTLAQYTAGNFDFSLADRRQAFNDIFSGAGGNSTRTSLLALWKRNATNAEKLFANGLGSDATPATSAFADGFLLTATDVETARTS